MPSMLIMLIKQIRMTKHLGWLSDVRLQEGEVLKDQTTPLSSHSVQVEKREVVRR